MSTGATIDAKAVLVEAILHEAREEKAPSHFLFSAPSLVRSPWLWVLAFEERSVTAADFSSVDGTRGPLARDFKECAERAFSGRDEAPFVVPASMGGDIDRLAAEFSALGILYCRVPLATAGSQQQAAQEMLMILRPLVVVAEATVRRLTAAFITQMGGSAEKYLLARHLDPLLFAAAERDALRKATTRAESAVTPNREQHRNRCHACGVVFTGRYKLHQQVCTKRKRPRTGTADQSP